METSLYYYHIDGIILRSNVHLPELIPATPTADIYNYDFYFDTPVDPPDYNIYYQFETGNGTPLLKLERALSSFILRFNDIADFTISEGSHRIHCHPFHDVEINSVRHLLLDNVLPQLLNLHGKIVLHASAIATNKGAAAFIAPSGTGKSSLVSAFCQQGIALMADDSVVVEKQADGFWLIPSYPGVRLWSPMVEALWQQSVMTAAVSHYTRKQRIVLQVAGLPFHDAPAPLKKIYVLAPPSDDFTIEAITLRDAHIQLVQQSFRLDIINKKNMITSFAFFNEMIKTIPFSQVYYPRKVELLPQIVADLLKDADL